jgi:hypothetical protein
VWKQFSFAQRGTFTRSGRPAPSSHQVCITERSAAGLRFRTSLQREEHRDEERAKRAGPQGRCGGASAVVQT